MSQCISALTRSDRSWFYPHQALHISPRDLIILLFKTSMSLFNKWYISAFSCVKICRLWFSSTSSGLMYKTCRLRFQQCLLDSYITRDFPPYPCFLAKKPGFRTAWALKMYTTFCLHLNSGHINSLIVKEASCSLKSNKMSTMESSTTNHLER